LFGENHLARLAQEKQLEFRQRMGAVKVLKEKKRQGAER
jgi:hypothetical protein